MRRIVLLVTVVTVMVAMTALPAFANHEHFLTTPGTTVQDIASGQTEKCSSAPGGHKFHENVHVGKPGTFAFGQGDPSDGGLEQESHLLVGSWTPPLPGTTPAGADRAQAAIRAREAGLGGEGR